jgi:hypothetical protein
MIFDYLWKQLMIGQEIRMTNQMALIPPGKENTKRSFQHYPFSLQKTYLFPSLRKVGKNGLYFGIRIEISIGKSLPSGKCS